MAQESVEIKCQADSSRVSPAFNLSPKTRDAPHTLHFHKFTIHLRMPILTEPPGRRYFNRSLFICSHLCDLKVGPEGN